MNQTYVPKQMSYFPKLDADDLPIRPPKKARVDTHLSELLEDALAGALGLSKQDEQGYIT
jgi:hypothetical protein